MQRKLKAIFSSVKVKPSQPGLMLDKHLLLLLLLHLFLLLLPLLIPQHLTPVCLSLCLPALSVRAQCDWTFSVRDETCLPLSPSLLYLLLSPSHSPSVVFSVFLLHSRKLSLFLSFPLSTHPFLPPSLFLPLSSFSSLSLLLLCSLTTSSLTFPSFALYPPLHLLSLSSLPCSLPSFHLVMVSPEWRW